LKEAILEITAKTFYGLESTLAKELENLGAKNINLSTRAVTYLGDDELLYKSNLHLRTALKVLVPVYSFSAMNEDILYKKVYDFNWSKYLRVDQTFAISSAVHSDQFRHSKFVALKVKDAIVDQFRNKSGIRPSVDIDNADIRFNVYTSGTDFTISLDSSGESLHKRGYRLKGHDAPLNEALAASMVLLTDWNKNIPLIDPMCGSGTIPIEAAMIACNIPPGIKREKFAFMNWSNFDNDLWKRIYKDALANIVKGELMISASDVSQLNIRLSRETAEKFGLGDQIKFSSKNFKNLLPETETGIIIMNPPYGERLAGKDIDSLYKMIGDNLKQNYSGFEAWILSSNKDALKHIGLRPSKKYTLFNGALECKYQKFSLYKGSIKKKYVDDA
jgi:putative N6-adenine-specific DNA methylase